MANRWGNSDRLYFLGLQNHCRWQLQPCNSIQLGRKAMINLNSVLKSRDITLPSEVHIVEAMVFPVVTCESWIIKRAESWKIDCFELWCWRRLLRVPWTARRSNQSILKEMNPEYAWKDWCWSWSSNTLANWCEGPTHWKRPWCWERLKAGGVGDHREWDGWMTSPMQLTWVEQAAGAGEGPGSLACCSLWDCKELNMTEQLKSNLFNYSSISLSIV